MATTVVSKQSHNDYRLAVGSRRLGLLADGSYFEEDAQISFGVMTAVQGFGRAIFQEGSLDACDFFAPAPGLHAAQQQVARLTDGPTRTKGFVWPLEALAGRLVAAPPLALHDPSGYLTRLHYLRSQVAPGRYPITVGHHTVSYTFMRHERFLPLLMAGFRPYDAIVCSSSTGREAIAALLDRN